MSRIQFTIINDGEGHEFVTAIIPGYDPLVASNEHPNFGAIKASLSDEGVNRNADDFADLFDIPQAIANQFDPLSERVSVGNGRVYFDGDEVDNAVTQQIVRFLDEGEDFSPLVAFMENIAANPNEHSREQLYTWLQRRDFAIDDDGHIVAYKGVRPGQDGEYFSLNAGPAIVDGKQHEGGPVPQRVGQTVELPRSEVAHDPSAACSTGLHVGTYDYARGYARDGAFLKVTVNPRDVVSVPTGDYGDKVRVCRYVIQDVIDPENGEVTTARDSKYTGRCNICGKPAGDTLDGCTVARLAPDVYQV